MLQHKVQARAIKNAIETGSRFIVVCHQKPDADTLGAGSAWLLFLRSKGKTVNIFCLDAAQTSLSHLPASAEITSDVNLFSEPHDVIIINDTGSPDYAGVEAIVRNPDRKATVINIDHHATNKHYGDINLVLSEASSTTEILTRLFLFWEEPITKGIAEALLHGLVTDTDKLMNPATNYHSFAVASKLVGAGADLYDVVERTLRQKSIPELKIWGVALSRLHHNPTYRSITTYITEDEIRQHGADPDSVEGIVNYLTLIPSANIITFLRVRDDGTIKGSFRSVKDHIDVSRLASRFGGGGHRKASGFTISARLEPKKIGWTIS